MSRARGFTLIELLIVVVIIGILALIVTPSLQRALIRGGVARATGDVKAIEIEIVQFEIATGRYPTSLAEVGRTSTLDPWGQTYQYLNIAGGGGGTPKTDPFGIQLNDDFDLYSMGFDLLTASSITAGSSLDDIVRGNNGGFVGLASDY